MPTPREGRSLNSADPTARLSIVIPVLNEGASLADHLTALSSLGDQGVEIIVVDGGSSDASVHIARPLANRVIASQPGRARQMNLGAQHASAPALLFLHADTQLPGNAVEQITQALGRHAWGHFAINLSGRSRWLPVVSTMMNLRSRLTGIATGDQGIFVHASTFTAVGGFPDQPLMEDIELSKRLKQLSHPACLRSKVISSGRRWDQHGAWSTIRLMWRLRYRYWRGVSATQLAREYRDAR
ncbi:TIGR04283 family arsenosugar biosynthesis glycosyltransferase [Halomonas janggokensis]|uniref:TIGR04283 family arsenosugar biosynthesis glycosyltransferase n=1 Tax=Vreelandella janggokensis TaxID=370767 RepID=A0ABT4IRX2_9GAMM|nr:TIGR04283 family arsenosugar biosynthesis glycosyltransferase [Halomonas janggokensis]MCZ0926210.1 TIGR04283 family arsenosugar biosynthesis glycosyltransferase [Halomonas janggokensis]MCZ0931277.1 TIGR04283 family arsenosugar biosynthesis glycosyltransferase [Halomonas janggokensis]